MRILVIEDDRATADYVAKGLTEEGFVVDVARTGKDGLFLALNEPFDVIVTDRMLPGPDGLSIVRAIRASNIGTPVLMLTALGDVDRAVARAVSGRVHRRHCRRTHAAGGSRLTGRRRSA